MTRNLKIENDKPESTAKAVLGLREGRSNEAKHNLLAIVGLLSIF